MDEITVSVVLLVVQDRLLNLGVKYRLSSWCPKSRVPQYGFLSRSEAIEGDQL